SRIRPDFRVAPGREPPLRSFPTRRSSDLRAKLTSVPGLQVIARGSSIPYKKTTKTPKEIARDLDATYLLTATVRWEKSGGTSRRSEEHTSEPQSHLKLVCRLLLEKKQQRRLPRGAWATGHQTSCRSCQCRLAQYPVDWNTGSRQDDAGEESADDPAAARVRSTARI